MGHWLNRSNSGCNKSTKNMLKKCAIVYDRDSHGRRCRGQNQSYNNNLLGFFNCDWDQ